MIKILKNESIVELIKLKDLVDNKVRFTTPIIFKYIKEFQIFSCSKSKNIFYCKIIFYFKFFLMYYYF